jgi:hypothetical protein
MRKVIRKTVRRSGDGLDLVADVDAVIAINTQRGGVSRTEAHSSHSVVQGGAGERDQPDEPSEKHTPGPPEKEQT